MDDGRRRREVNKRSVALSLSVRIFGSLRPSFALAVVVPLPAQGSPECAKINPPSPLLSTDQWKQRDGAQHHTEMRSI